MTFDKGESKFEKKMFVCVCVCGGGGGAHSTEIHNLEHVVNLTFLNIKALILSSLLSLF